MADDDRTATTALAFQRDLQRKPYQFDFFQALRRLECAFADKPRLGTALRLSDDPVRLGQEPSLAFAPSTVASFRPGGGGKAARLWVFFLGLFGPNGPLPLHLTEYARSRMRTSDDPTFARFADLFHHRMLSLFYRGWADSQPTVSFDRDKDPFGTKVGSLEGIGLKTLRDRDPMPDLLKLHYTGHLGCHTRHPEGLRSLIRGYFDMGVRILEFIGEWLLLPRENRLYLGVTRKTCTLGENAILGARVWDVQMKFRIVMGPMDFANFMALLPGRHNLPVLDAIVKNYTGVEFMWDVNLILKKEEVPSIVLGKSGLLGWTTWLKTEPFEEDADDLVLEPANFLN